MFAVLPSQSLDIHRSRRVRTKTIEYHCQYCQRRFNKSYNLMIHERTHDEPTHSCELCGKTFKKMDALRQHRSQAHLPPVYFTTNESQSHTAIFSA